MKCGPYLKLTVFIVLFFSFLPGGCWAGESNTQDDGKRIRNTPHPHKKLPGMSSENRLKYEMNFDYFKGFLADTAHIVTSPLRYNSSDWMKVAVVLGTTGILLAVDEDAQDFFQRNKSSTTDKISDWFEPLGRADIQAPVLGGLYLVGAFLDNDKLKRVSLLSLETFGITALLTTGVKRLSGRRRPLSDKQEFAWRGPSFSSKNTSFPSGHTSSMFAIATTISLEFPEEPLVSILAYTTAGLTSFARLNDNEHWVSDAFFGACLGYFISKTVMKLHSDNKGHHFTIYPNVNRQTAGLTFNLRY